MDRNAGLQITRQRCGCKRGPSAAFRGRGFLGTDEAVRILPGLRLSRLFVPRLFVSRLFVSGASRCPTCG